MSEDFCFKFFFKNKIIRLICSSIISGIILKTDAV